MSNLTDTQLTILSAAAKRDTGAVLPLPKSLKLNQAAISSVLKSLLNKGLLEEILAKPREPHWRAAEGNAFALVITDKGLAALGIDDKPATAQKTSYRSTKPKASKEKPAKSKKNKSEQILDLVSRSSGASIEELQASTGWQSHSVRAVIAGLRKKGREITLVRHEGKPSTYHAGARAS